MDLSTISVYSLNCTSPKVATTPAQYAGLMQDLSAHLIESAQGMIELEELMTVGMHNAQAIDNIEVASVVIENSVAAPWAVSMVNAGSGFIDSLVATEGLSINTNTQAERQRLASVTVEGLGSKIKDAYKKVIAWFKEMWKKFSTWLKNLFDKKARMLAALESQKKRIDGMSNPTVDNKKEVTTISLVDAGKFGIQIKGLIDNVLMKDHTTAKGESSVTGDLTGKLKELGAEKKGTLAKLGYTDANTIKEMVVAAIQMLKNADRVKTVADKAEEIVNKGIAAAEKVVAAAKDKDAIAAAKKTVATERKKLMAITKSTGVIDSAIMRLAANALKLAKYIKAKE